MGKEGWKYVMENFSEEVYMSKVLNMIDDIIQ